MKEPMQCLHHQVVKVEFVLVVQLLVLLSVLRKIRMDEIQSASKGTSEIP